MTAGPAIPETSAQPVRQDVPDSADAAYIHVPFCRHRCGYCDFTLVARRDHLIEPYLDTLARELGSLGERRTVTTLFIGGGTPTHLPAAALRRFFDLVAHWFRVRDGGEFSVEANPSGLDEQRCEILRSAGVNRVSLGAQSFDARHLATLERDHTPDQIRECVQRLRGWCDNLSLDLIFGVPGQSLPDWEQTLAAAIDCRPDHLSAYGLTFEEGTAYWTRRARGQLRQVDEGVEREMYELAMTTLPKAGLSQYEISNYARPVYESRHNQTYWQGRPYFGFGPGAASYLNGERRLNTRSVTQWIERIGRGESPVTQRERLDPQARAKEGVMLGLRQTSGIDREQFAQQFGYELDDLLEPALTMQKSLSRIDDDGRAIRLSWEGRFVADTVVAEFL